MCYTKQPRRTRAKQRLCTRPIHKTTTLACAPHLLICVGLYTGDGLCGCAWRTHARASICHIRACDCVGADVIIALAKNKRINFYYSHCLRSSAVTGSYTLSHSYAKQCELLCVGDTVRSQILMCVGGDWTHWSTVGCFFRALIRYGLLALTSPFEYMVDNNERQ